MASEFFMSHIETQASLLNEEYVCVGDEYLGKWKLEKMYCIVEPEGKMKYQYISQM
jgi:hypothetical protein